MEQYLSNGVLGNNNYFSNGVFGKSLQNWYTWNTTNKYTQGSGPYRYNSTKAYQNNLKYNGNNGNENDRSGDNFEKYIDDMEDRSERNTKRTDDLKFYLTLMASFFVLPREVAAYFSTGKLINFYFGELGYSLETALFFMLFIRAVNIPQFAHGRLVLVDGYLPSWLKELYNYSLSKMEVDDLIRIGSQLFFPQGPMPDYGDNLT